MHLSKPAESVNKRPQRSRFFTERLQPCSYSPSIAITRSLEDNPDLRLYAENADFDSRAEELDAQEKEVIDSNSIQFQVNAGWRFLGAAWVCYYEQQGDNSLIDISLPVFQQQLQQFLTTNKNQPDYQDVLFASRQVKTSSEIGNLTSGLRSHNM